MALTRCIVPALCFHFRISLGDAVFLLAMCSADIDIAETCTVSATSLFIRNLENEQTRVSDIGLQMWPCQALALGIGEQQDRTR